MKPSANFRHHAFLRTDSTQPDPTAPLNKNWGQVHFLFGPVPISFPKTLMRALIVLGCRKGKEKKTDGRWFWWLPDPLTGPVISGSPALRPGTLELKSLADISAEANKAKTLANTTKKGT